MYDFQNFYLDSKTDLISRLIEKIGLDGSICIFDKIYLLVACYERERI